MPAAGWDNACREMTGGIPNRYVSAQLAAEMGVDVEEGQSEALIPSVDEVTLQNWFMATCEQVDWHLAFPPAAPEAAAVLS